MNSYRYKVTVEALTDGKGESTEGRTLSFEAANHDDIAGVVERMRAGSAVRRGMARSGLRGD